MNAGAVLLAAWLLASQEAPPRAAPSETAAAESPYARWSHGPPTDPSWFPLGVWLQEPRLAERYSALRINTYVGLWKGPTEEQLDLLEAAGMKVICSANAVGLARAKSDLVIAWMQVDEPENRAPSGGPNATVEQVRTRYRRLRRRDPTRPVWMNLGQGVANDAWHGLGAPRSDYPHYAQAADILSFDVYPVTNLRKRDGENWLWFVAKGVERLRRWAGPERPVWNVIETTRGVQARIEPTPEQVRAEVWLSLVAGSRGIVYFCHEFEEPASSAALLLDPRMSRAVQRINEEVLALASVLNAPTLEGHVRVESAKPRVPIGTLLKRLGDDLYLLAIAQRNDRTTARFSLEGLGVEDGPQRVEVLNEGRRLALEGGRFRDAFEPYGLHVYRLRTGEER